MDASVEAGRARHSVLRADWFQGATARTDGAPCLLWLDSPAVGGWLGVPY